MKTRPDLEWKNGKVVPCRLLVFEGYCNGKVIFGIEREEFWLGLFNGKNLALPECLNFIFRYAKMNGCNIVTSAPHPVGDRAHKLYFKYHPDGYWYRNI